MRGKPAKVLGAGDVRRMLAAAGRRRHAERDRVIVMLSVKAGLRACEISALTWEMLLKPDGTIGRLIELPPGAAKKGSGRIIPVHPDLKRALERLGRNVAKSGPMVKSERGGAMTAKSIVNWFHGLYRELGLRGCSSHSGRRTFITRSARLIHKTGGSLRDIQELAGHRSIKTTQGYIEGDAVAQRRLIRLL
jgi:integrase/recombinase XerD